jgi:hypothetical protein
MFKYTFTNEVYMKFFRALALFVMSFSAIAGEGSEQLFGNWTTLFINGKFGKDSPWIYMGEVGIRASQGHKTSGGDQGYYIGSVPVRIGAGYQINKENSVMLGYLFQFSEPPYAKTDIYENRVWEQYQNVLNFGEAGVLQNRSRFEQRTITSSPGTALRWRQQVKYTYPINKEWGFVINEEFFANCNTVDWGPVAGFDQNRIFVGPSYQFNKESKMEFGYMNNYVNKDLKDDLDNHVFVMNFYYNVPD